MERDELARRDELVIAFLDKLVHSSPDQDLNMQDLKDITKQIYLDDNGKRCYRHSYGRIAKYLSDFKDDEDINAVLLNLDSFISWIEKDEESIKLELNESLRKLRDHIQLEQVHIEMIKSSSGINIQEYTSNAAEAASKYQTASKKFEEINEASERFEKRIKETDDRLKDWDNKSQDIEKQLKATNDEIKDHNTQTVTVLGIFAGVVFAFSGGFSLIGGALANIHKIRGIQTLFFLASILSIGLILYDVVYALLHFVGRYCDKEPQKVETFTKQLNIICIIMVIALLVLYFCFSSPHSDAGVQHDMSAYSATPDEAININHRKYSGGF